ncbi:MAG: hypothetical protein CFH19_00333 [Alphaproteobacteria bacterium MarineAlpha5_Bin9]|nr:MAG: hypothetical protein CFH19_00333 [Alphaproteobacteria bacterium MarineAlpha5_Bin9]|tara:strand:+ start:9262 stop:10860 length:1599 start_codon:yes stop_codon:yes gene_type:complete
MNVRSYKSRLTENTNIWPGFVDILSTLLIVIIFILMVFTVSQIYLSEAISGRDKALDDLRKQINELSKILVIESTQKQEALTKLEDTQESLDEEILKSEGLTLDIETKTEELSIQDLKIDNLAFQIAELLKELRVVAQALETYEGQEIVGLETSGLGERINKALASRIDQLNNLNKELKFSQEETSRQLVKVEELNTLLSKKEEDLQEQVFEYQKLTNDLIAINESLGLDDADLNDQLNAIKKKNEKLTELNKDLVEKETVIFDLTNKILELNNILSISEEKQILQEKEISNLGERVLSLEEDKLNLETSSSAEILASEKKASGALEQVGTLSNEIDILNKEIATLNSALEASEIANLTKELKIEVLGDRLNKALTSKVFELQKYRSEFFGRLQDILGDRDDIKVVGDRFIFESELLFDSGSATLQKDGEEKLKQIGLTLKETTSNIPKDIDWIIQVEGHTDKNPINTPRFPSNWELSTARANTVLKLLLELGFEPRKLSAAGYGEFYPLSDEENNNAYKQNRRIELRLTSR